MNQGRWRRLGWVLAIVMGVAASIAIALYALRSNISLYYTPKQIFSEQVQSNIPIRLGGIVETSMQNHSDIIFTLGQGKYQIIVHYQGILPTLFRVGQGVVVHGYLINPHVFMADQVLAKHDARYHPQKITPIRQRKTGSEL